MQTHLPAATGQAQGNGQATPISTADIPATLIPASLKAQSHLSETVASHSLPQAAAAQVPIVNAPPQEPIAELGQDLRQREFEIIRQTLKAERGSKKETAKRLGISARTLRYKMAKLREEGFDLNNAD